MMTWSDKLAWLVITLWVGALWVVGYVVAPSLFSQLASDKQLAGNLAGRLFELVAYIGFASAFFLIVQRLLRSGWSAFRQGFFWAVVVMLLIAVGGQYYIQPMMADLKAQALPLDVMQSDFAGQFSVVHGVASVGYLVQSLLGVVLIFKSRQ